MVIIQPSKKFDRRQVTGVQLIEKGADAPTLWSVLLYNILTIIQEFHSLN